MKAIVSGELEDLTLITLLIVPYLCHFGSSSFVLPIQPKYDILNRVIRVRKKLNFYELKSV